ncbi:hypothetical protein L202_02965 [Cryptococcus amylolentus CBS 6039]|uniref:Prefoldin subunit 4 n=1 Tax=Cryptococcus amylolentus CBS 6039 TaxID=1295533 RepID=A0A1E3HXB3_9TREE|nr:hypothetical protein L202_02965 [Cryptococcus amylolentus CBS 6039]ODN80815.1 hypothetical protein L202_02965 [Cryptococcus amylolentus CBS 6039]
MSLLPPEEEGDGIEVVWEDQQRINTFSKLNNRLSDIQDLLRAKKEEKEYYDDLSTELELADDDDPPTLYKIGESFFHLPLRDARRQLKKDMKRYETDIEGLEARAEECEKGMKELKVHLYAKFGKQINLETTP